MSYPSHRNQIQAQVLREFGPTTYRSLRNLLRALDGETQNLEKHTREGKALIEEIQLIIQERSQS